MRAILAVTILAACGAGPDKPLLANAPRPPQAAVAGVAAAAAAAITLASPTSTRTPERDEERERAPMRVDESVPGDVLDRLDRAEAARDARPDPPETEASRAPTRKTGQPTRTVLPTGKSLFDVSGTFSKPPTAGGF